MRERKREREIERERDRERKRERGGLIILLFTEHLFVRTIGGKKNILL